MADWYEKKIEPEIRPIVKMLRDNGINTECSCGHRMYVQCQYLHDGFLKEVDDILFNAGYINYKMTVTIIREYGYLRHTMNIIFSKMPYDIGSLKSDIKKANEESKKEK